MGDPIMIDCEGAGVRGHLLGVRDPGVGVYSCAMCGQTFVAVTNRMPEHQREDVLAMIQRGDF